MSQLVLPHTIDAGTEIVAVEHQANYVAIRDLINGNLEGGGGVNGNIKANGITARELADDVLRWQPSVAFQDGVTGSGHGKVTPGSGLVLNYAAADAYISDGAAVLTSNSALLPAFFAGSTVTIAANSSGNPRIDQVIATLTGYRTATVSVLQGTASVGATLANRTGAAALPAGAIRLADILMPNGFAGPFVQTTHIRDRRQWARGLGVIASSTATPTPANNTWTELVSADINPRVEFSGTSAIRIAFNGTAYGHLGGSGAYIMAIGVDGVQGPQIVGGMFNPLDAGKIAGTRIFAAGTWTGHKKLSPFIYAETSSTWKNLVMTVEEIPATFVADPNSGA